MIAKMSTIRTTHHITVQYCKVIIHKSRGEVYLVEQDTIDMFLQPILSKKKINFLQKIYYATF